MKSERSEFVHIRQLRAGDTIVHNGELKTVSHNNLRYDEFMGVSVFGDSYQVGHKKIERVHFGVRPIISNRSN